MTGWQINAMRALYGKAAPSFEDLRRTLPDLGDGLHAQLQALYDTPSESACEQLAANLDGARRFVLRLADAMHKEASE